MSIIIEHFQTDENRRESLCETKHLGFSGPFNCEKMITNTVINIGQNQPGY